MWYSSATPNSRSSGPGGAYETRLSRKRPPPLGQAGQRDIDALGLDLDRADHEDDGRIVGRPLGPRRKLSRIEGLADVRDRAETQRLQAPRESGGDGELVRGKAIDAVDLLAKVGFAVVPEPSLVALREVKDGPARAFESERNGAVEGCHADVRLGEGGGVAVGGALEARASEAEPLGGRLGRDDGHAVAAAGERVGLLEDDLHSTVETGGFEEVCDPHVPTLSVAAVAVATH